MSSSPDVTDGQEAEVLDAIVDPETPLTVVAPPPAFYSVDSTRVTVREYRFGNPWALMPLALLLRTLRVRIPGSSDDLPVESLLPFETSETSVPETVRALMAPMIAELSALGFVEPVYHAVDDPHHRTQTYYASLRHTSGRAIARVHRRVWLVTRPPKEYLYPEFLTAFEDGTFLWSNAAKPDLLWPESSRMNRHIGKGAAELWRSHEAELANATASAVAPVRSADETRDLLERHHMTLRDFHLARGVFKPLAGEESRLASELAASEAVSRWSADDRAVYAEMLRLQRKKTHWSGVLLLLAVSLGVFFAAGAAASDWKWLFMVVPILFVHELGHYVAMKASGYRDLKMFFLPLVGAAVTGKAENVAGWKKALVALAGPVPGIVIGTVIGIVGMVTGHKLVLEIAVWTIGINAFNLLPFLPLDGGHVMRAVLFSRNYILDLVFRGAAIAVMALIGMLTGSPFLWALAAVLGVGMFSAYRVGRAADELRRRGLPIDQRGFEVPPGIASAILTELRGKVQRKTHTRILAQEGLQVFEALATRPPGVGASFGLLGVHGAAFVGAIVFTSLFVAAQHFNIGDVVHTAAATPDHVPLGEDGVESVHSGAHRDDPQPRLTVTADLASESAAKLRLAQLRPQLPQGGSLHRFGRTLMVMLPVDESLRETWVARMSEGVPPERVRVDRREYRRILSLTCVAPDEAAAERMEAELTEHFALMGQEWFSPPWCEPDPRTPEQREQHRRARRTLMQLRKAAWGREDPERDEISRKMQEAARVGDQKRVDALMEELKTHTLQRTEAAMKAVREDPDADAAFVDRYLAMREMLPKQEGWPQETPDAFVAQLGDALGEIDQDDTASLAVASESGYVERRGSVLTITFMGFTRLPDGSEAAVKWLRARGCGALRYQFTDYDAEFLD